VVLRVLGKEQEQRKAKSKREESICKEREGRKRKEERAKIATPSSPSISPCQCPLPQ
jgi:hypothetical protein